MKKMHNTGLERILRFGELVQITGLSRSSIYRNIERGLFPRPRKLSARSIGWLQSDVEAWLQKVRTNE